VGRLDLWRQKLTPFQVKKIQEMTPESLLEKFEWIR